MTGNLETFHEKANHTTEAGSLSALQREVYVFSSGIAGSFKEMGTAAEEAVKHPGATAIRVGTSAVVAGVLGFCARRASVAGILARGAMATLGATFTLDAICPLGSAFSDAIAASSRRDLDRASRSLATSLGRFEFDTLVSLPVAISAGFAGRSLSTAWVGTSEAAGTSRVASGRPATAASESPRVSHTEARPRTTAGQTRQARPEIRHTAPRERVVLEGEVVIEPKVRSQGTGRRAEPEVIDAEFTVVEERLALTSRSVELPTRSAAQLRLGYKADTGRSNLPAVTSESSLSQLPARTADTSLAGRLARQAYEPVRDPQPTAADIKRALEAYSEPGPPPGSFLNVEA